MTNLPTPTSLPLWRRLAVLLSFAAVFLALCAPASMLAEEARTGKLGGVCLVASAAKAIDSSEQAPGSTHCDMCGSLVFVLPLFSPQALPSCPGLYFASVDLPSDLLALVEGLPPSRGPPAP